jgi:hypothetical protein
MHACANKLTRHSGRHKPGGGAVNSGVDRLQHGLVDRGEVVECSHGGKSETYFAFADTRLLAIAISCCAVRGPNGSLALTMADERRGGKMAKGTRGQLNTAGPGRRKKGKTGGVSKTPPVFEERSLADLGVDKSLAHEARRAAAMRELIPHGGLSQ